MKLDTSFVIRDLLCVSELTGQRQRERIYKLLCRPRRTNLNRARCIQPYFEDFAATELAAGEPAADVACDFLTDVFHLFTCLELDAENIISRAMDHHASEVLGEKRKGTKDAR